MSQSQTYPISPELKKFFVDIQHWIDSGCPEDNKYFYKYYGLGANLTRYEKLFGLHEEISDELDSLLGEEYGNYIYPFGGHSTLCSEAGNNTVYKNPERLAFIRKYATS